MSSDANHPPLPDIRDDVQVCVVGGCAQEVFGKHRLCPSHVHLKCTRCHNPVLTGKKKYADCLSLAKLYLDKHKAKKRKHHNKVRRVNKLISRVHKNSAAETPCKRLKGVCRANGCTTLTAGTAKCDYHRDRDRLNAAIRRKRKKGDKDAVRQLELELSSLKKRPVAKQGRRELYHGPHKAQAMSTAAGTRPLHEFYVSKTIPARKEVHYKCAHDDCTCTRVVAPHGETFRTVEIGSHGHPPATRLRRMSPDGTQAYFPHKKGIFFYELLVLQIRTTFVT